MNEMYNKHRPANYKQVVGQDDAVEMMQSWGDSIPHVVCFSGPTGVGKTTLARILRTELGCADSDYREYNAALSRGVDTIREVESKMGLAPMRGNCRIFYFDEAHRLTGDAQSGLLKMLEDCPKHVYFMLATTEPNKLLKTVHGRCTTVKLERVSGEDISKAVRRIIKLEKLDISSNVVEAIVGECGGSVRRAIVLLESVSHLETEEDQLAKIVREDLEHDAFDLVKILLGWGKGGNWSRVAEIAQSIPENDLESFRRLVLACATTSLIGSKNRKAPTKPNSHAYKVLVAFNEPWFNTGRAGLVTAITEVLFGE